MPLSDPRVSFAGVLLPVWLVTAAWDAICATALSVVAYGTTAATGIVSPAHPTSGGRFTPQARW